MIHFDTTKTHYVSKGGPGACFAEKIQSKISDDVPFSVMIERNGDGVVFHNSGGEDAPALGLWLIAATLGILLPLRRVNTEHTINSHPP